jgi:tetratricopeptide (TPR) repeat protein
LFASLALLQPANAQDDAGITSMLAEADELIAANKLPEALNKTQQIIKSSPDNLLALQKRINVYFLMNNQKEAIQYVEEAIRKYPDVAGFYYLRGTINSGREKYIRALDDFSKAISLEPTSDLYKCYLGRGVCYLNLLEYEQALSDFTASIELNDTVASAYHSRALMNYETRDYAAAVNDFLKTIELSAGNSTVYFNLGMSYYRLNEKDKACPYFHKACTMGNTNACRMTLMECAKAIPIIP